MCHRERSAGKAEIKMNKNGFVKQFSRPFILNSSFSIPYIIYQLKYLKQKKQAPVGEVGVGGRRAASGSPGDRPSSQPCTEAPASDHIWARFPHLRSRC